MKLVHGGRTGKRFKELVSAAAKKRRQIVEREHLDQLAVISREYTDQAIQTIVDIMIASDSDKNRLAAAQMLLDRGFGRIMASRGDQDEPNLPDNVKSPTEQLNDFLDRFAESRPATGEPTKE